MDETTLIKFQMKLILIALIFRAFTVLFSYDLVTGVSIWSRATDVVHCINLMQVAILVCTMAFYPRAILYLLRDYRWIVEYNPPKIDMKDAIMQMSDVLKRVDNGNSYVRKCISDALFVGNRILSYVPYTHNKEPPIKVDPAFVEQYELVIHQGKPKVVEVIPSYDDTGDTRKTG